MISAEGSQIRDFIAFLAAAQKLRNAQTAIDDTAVAITRLEALRLYDEAAAQGISPRDSDAMLSLSQRLFVNHPDHAMHDVLLAHALYLDDNVDARALYREAAPVDISYRQFEEYAMLICETRPRLLVQFETHVSILMKRYYPRTLWKSILKSALSPFETLLMDRRSLEFFGLNKTADAQRVVAQCVRVAERVLKDGKRTCRQCGSVAKKRRMVGCTHCKHEKIHFCSLKCQVECANDHVYGHVVECDLLAAAVL